MRWSDEADAVEIYVEPHDAIPDGASLRYRTAGPVRSVRRVRFESDDGQGGTWRVRAPVAGDDDAPARGVEVHDSSAGVSLLVFGGSRGLRLRSEDDPAQSVAEAYLLLECDADRFDDGGEQHSGD